MAISAAKRASLPSSAFAYPKTRSYPIDAGPREECARASEPKRHERYVSPRSRSRPAQVGEQGSQRQPQEGLSQPAQPRRPLEAPERRAQANVCRPPPQGRDRQRSAAELPESRELAS